ncbi:Cyclase/dehydrase [Nitrosotalea sinensis]|jgi:carbon monoxide dehydrogenase subunit G|uniref:Cyclase/dehydrase n=2 Tax=Nitrosotalea sinensis TaxID=1499975 RepID=A0A2H1EJB1_9ARCH|nr:Cyclase/dehydrase [Candidatus Nitrosotalea sinensis]
MKNFNMVQIQASVDIDAPLDKVWNIISDLDSEPRFWKGTKEVRNISKNENVVTREVTIAFKDSKCMQTVTMQPKEKIHAQFTKGILDGTKTLTLQQLENRIRLDVLWDIKLTGMMGMFTGMIKKHIQSGSEQALESIKQEAQR